ncbi:Homeobox protein Hox-C5, partial [Mesitornis unicolor]|uniref:homeobox protein Hox-C5 n=1 Tax=Mesitornis unicolor TaxID=54374 RepID=UPI000528BA9A
MSSYVANSFYKQSPPVPAYTMQSYGNYGSVPEVQPPRYRYGGSEPGITLPSAGAATSLSGAEMSATPPANPERPSCTLLAAGHPLEEPASRNPGIYRQKSATPALEERSQSSGGIKAEPLQTPQPGGPQLQQQQQPPQIYPWMTKLHMSH